MTCDEQEMPIPNSRSLSSDLNSFGVFK